MSATSLIDQRLAEYLRGGMLAFTFAGGIEALRAGGNSLGTCGSSLDLATSCVPNLAKEDDHVAHVG